MLDKPDKWPPLGRTIRNISSRCWREVVLVRAPFADPLWSNLVKDFFKDLATEVANDFLPKELNRVSLVVERVLERREDQLRPQVPVPALLKVCLLKFSSEDFILSCDVVLKNPGASGR